MLRNLLQSILNTQFEDYTEEQLTGGDINKVYKVTTKDRVFCVKHNFNSGLSGMLKQEAMALEELNRKSNFHVPKVIGSYESQNTQFLIMDFIPKGEIGADFWDDFGEKLAEMHSMSRPAFGWDHDNYIGSLHQSNNNHDSWGDFYSTERILPQTRLAVDHGKCPQELAVRIEKLCATFEAQFPKEPPSLLHGDLWSGNYMVDLDGNPVLIDPALYYGHREMDLGMMLLFGGFHESLYAAYEKIYPLEKDWQQRIALTQLYPLLVHVNLFGGGYLQQVETVVRKYE